MWGYIDTDMETVIDFQFEYADSFVGGLASCRLPDGKYVLITKDGEATAESDSEIVNPNEKPYSGNYAQPEYIYYPYVGTDVRDRNGEVLFTYDGELDYLEHANVFALSRYKVYSYQDSALVKFELLDTTGKCVFRKNVVSQWSYD